MSRRGGACVGAGVIGLALGFFMGCSSSSNQNVTPDAPAVTPDGPVVTPDAPSGAHVTGTAAMGGPIAGATVTAKDQTGATASATTDASGKFSVDVGALAGPFLLEVAPPGHAALFGYAPAPGAANVDPFTSLVVDLVYQVHGTTVADAFAALSPSSPAPAPIEVQTVASLAPNMLATWLQTAGVPLATFDVMAGGFVADHNGFDQVLDRTTTGGDTVTISDGTTTQTIVLAAAPSGQVTASSTTVGPSGTTSTLDSVQVPGTSGAQALVACAATALDQLKQVVNDKGQALTDQDVLPLFAPDYLNEGGARALGAAGFATNFRGATIATATIDRVVSYDAVAQVIGVDVLLTGSNGGRAASFRTVLFFSEEGSSCLLYGDQRVITMQHPVQLETRTDSNLVGPDMTYLSINVQTDAPTGTISDVFVTGGPFNDTLLAKNPFTTSEILRPTPTTTLIYVSDGFGDNPGPQTTLPPPGSVFTFTVLRPGVPMVTYSVATTSVSGEAIQYTVSPATHTLANIIGKTLTVTWQLPRTYASTQIQLGGSVRDAQTEVFIDGTIDAGGTSGTIAFPATLPTNGNTVVGAGMNLSITGPNGERGLVVYGFQ